MRDPAAERLEVMRGIAATAAIFAPGQSHKSTDPGSPLRLGLYLCKVEVSFLESCDCCLLSYGPLCTTWLAIAASFGIAQLTLIPKRPRLPFAGGIA